MPSHLDPIRKGSLQFLFTRCQARLDGEDLVVAIAPGATFRGGVDRDGRIEWSVSSVAPAEAIVDCEPGPRRRGDHREYPSSAAYEKAAAFRFRGGFEYCRVALGDGWALCVQAQVRAVTGLPAAWAEWDAVSVEPAAGTQPVMLAAADTSTADTTTTDGGTLTDGPHLPYP